MNMRCRVPDLIRLTAADRGDAPALIAKNDTRTYAQLWHDVQAVGAGLQRLGVARGNRVAVYLDKRVETVAAIFGAAAAGAVFVPVNPLLRPRQVVYIAADCGAQVLVTTPERYESLRHELEHAKTIEHVILVGPVDDLVQTAGATLHRWSDVASASPCDLVDAGTIDLDMAAILYTSGSTGRPKGVVLSHRNIIVGAESVSHYLENGPDDVILAALPLSFDAGFSQVTTGFVSGAHVVLVNYLLPGDVVRECVKHGVTGLTCVPPLWMQIVDQSWPAEAAARLRYFANTGGRMPKTTLDKLRALFPAAKPYLMYGLTEAFRSTYLDPAQVDIRPDSIGKAIPNAEIIVVRPDGTMCDPGEEGELVHRGALVAMGYWNDAERTSSRFRPAPGRERAVCTTEIAVWSGDAVVRDEKGFLYFIGRRDEMIKTSGYRVSPTEIEEAAYDTGLVGDAVAFGVEDSTLGQAIVLVVTALGDGKLDEAALLTEMKRQLPLYMVPRQVITRTAIPRSPNGKFDRNLLRQELDS